MSDKPANKTKENPETDSRNDRRAEALRANLRKRKEQARARKAGADERPESGETDRDAL